MQKSFYINNFFTAQSSPESSVNNHLLAFYFNGWMNNSLKSKTVFGKAYKINELFVTAHHHPFISLSVFPLNLLCIFNFFKKIYFPFLFDDDEMRIMIMLRIAVPILNLSLVGI